MSVIRPRCCACGVPAEKSITPKDDGPPEFYCAACLAAAFSVAPEMSARERIDLAAKRHVTGTN